MAIWFQLVKVLTQFSNKPTIGHVILMKGRAFQLLGAQRLRRIDANSSKRRTDRAKTAPAATSCVQLCRLLEEHGFVEVRQRGSHIVM
jgi:hypothetical protein